MGLEVRRMEVEVTWILAGMQDVNSSVEGEPDEHEVGKLRMMEKIWNSCWENIREESNGSKQKVCLITVQAQLRQGIASFLYK